MRPRHIAFAAACALLALPACAGQQVEKLTARVHGIEEREARIDELEQRLARMEESNQRLTQLVEMMAGQFQTVKTVADALAAMQREQEPPEEDASVVYAVPVDGSPVEGPADAKVTIVKAFEFACPFCERSRSTLSEIRSKYGKDVRIVYKHFIVHEDYAMVPARAVCAAHLQGKFTAMKDAIWDHGFHAGRDLSEENMKRQARRVGLDMRRFEKDMNGPCAERVRQDHALLAKVGVQGTPYFYINGRLVRGSMPFDVFQPIIDEELAKATQVIQSQGVKPAEYYDRVIVANGRTAK